MIKKNNVLLYKQNLLYNNYLIGLLKFKRYRED